MQSPCTITEGLWMFYKATLMNERVNRSGSRTNNEGLLIATLLNRQTGIKENRSVCKDAFSWHLATYICRSIGYIFADWGIQPINMLYTSKYFCSLSFISLYSYDIIKSYLDVQNKQTIKQFKQFQFYLIIYRYNMCKKCKNSHTNTMI